MDKRIIFFIIAIIIVYSFIEYLKFRKADLDVLQKVKTREPLTEKENARWDKIKAIYEAAGISENAQMVESAEKQAKKAKNIQTWTTIGSVAAGVGLMFVPGGQLFAAPAAAAIKGAGSIAAAKTMEKAQS